MLNRYRVNRIWWSLSGRTSVRFVLYRKWFLSGRLIILHLRDTPTVNHLTHSDSHSQTPINIVNKITSSDLFFFQSLMGIDYIFTLSLTLNMTSKPERVRFWFLLDVLIHNCYDSAGQKGFPISALTVLFKTIEDFLQSFATIHVFVFNLCFLEVSSLLPKKLIVLAAFHVFY